jgi:RNA polymerase sigma factor (sigma-70 family)
MPPTRPVSTEVLLSHAGWVRALARSLLGDPHAAEDVVQETWLAALQRGPREGRPLSAWLARVARNFARRKLRSEARRSERERLGVRAEGEPSPADLYERAALHRELVEAVMKLDEPYRSTILLRYFEGLAPRAIARREGVPVRTVSTRLARGLEKLRARLDASSGGGRKAWMSALAAFTRNPFAVGPSATLVTIMTTNLKLVGAGVLLSAILVAFLALKPRTAARPPTVVSAAVETTSASPIEPASGPSAIESVAADSERLGAAPERAPTAASRAKDPLEPATDLHGVVTDSAGSHLRGARIEVRRSEARSFDLLDDNFFALEEHLVAETASDDRGEFHVRVPRARPFDLYASLSGYAVRKLPSRYAGESVHVVLTAGCTIFGRVTRQSDGAPCAAAIVHARPGVVSLRGAAEYEAVSDASGAYRLEGLPPGGIVLDADSPEEAGTFGSAVETHEGSTLEKDIVLEPGRLVTGTVTDANTGSPIPGAEVRAAGRPSTRVAQTDADGRYAIRGLHTEAEWSDDVDVTAVGYAKLAHRVPSFSSEPVQLDFQLRAGHTAKGRVLGPDDWPLAGALVIASGRGSSGDTQFVDEKSIRTGRAGTFLLADLAPEVRHTLFVRKDGFGTKVYAFPIDEADRTSIDFGDLRLPEPAMLLGRVVDEKGAPVPDTFVSLDGTNSDRLRFSDPSRGLVQSRSMLRSGRTDDQGRFGFADISPGDYLLTATGMKGSATSAHSAVRIAEGEVNEGLELVLRIGLLLEGRVLDPAGNPRPGMSVSVFREPHSPGAREAYDITRGDGSFHIQGLDDGTYTIRVESFFDGAEDLAIGRLSGIPAGSRDLTVLLPRAEWIAGTVLGPDGAPAADAQVQAADPGSDSAEWDWPEALARTDAQGRFRLKVRASCRVNLTAFDAPREVDAGWEPGLGAEANGIAAGASDVVLRLAPLR